MCNLYANTTAQEAMRRLFKIEPALDQLGNFDPLPAIWPKYEAPVVRLTEQGERELVMMHWGFLTPAVSKKTGKPILPAVWNNARDDNLKSGLWKSSFERRRCLIPATAFREAKGKNPATDFWFALLGEEDRPSFAFAGLWRQGQPGVEGDARAWTTHTMITTTANDLVKPIHPTRMPVILNDADHEAWLHGTEADAFALLEPYPEDQMQIVRQGVGITSDTDDFKEPQ